jgi:hypothetical protein
MRSCAGGGSDVQARRSGVLNNRKRQTTQRCNRGAKRAFASTKRMAVGRSASPVCRVSDSVQSP